MGTEPDLDEFAREAEAAYDRSRAMVPYLREHPTESLTQHTVTCLECGQRFRNLTWTHLMHRHGLDLAQYREKWGFPPEFVLQPADVTIYQQGGKAREKRLRERVRERRRKDRERKRTKRGSKRYRVWD